MSSTPPFPEFHDDYRVTHAVVILVFAFFTCLAISLRLWARKIQNLALSLSDYTILLGLLFALAESGLNLYECCIPDKWKTAEQKSPKDETFHLKIIFALQLVWLVAVTLIRVSIVLLYMQIFLTRSFRIACYVVLAFNLVYFTTIIVGDCLICKPIAYNWNYAIPGGSCGDTKSFSIYSASLNLLLDFIVVILPMRILWGLQMATRRKMALSGLFSLGLAICAVTAYRVYVTTVITDPSAPDSKRAYSVIALATSLETLLGITAACLPMSKPAAQTLWNSLPKYSRDKISAATSAMSSIIPYKSRFLSLRSMGPSSLGLTWSSSNRMSHQSQAKVGDRYSSLDDDGMLEMEKGQVHVHRSVEVKSEMRDISR